MRKLLLIGAAIAGLSVSTANAEQSNVVPATIAAGASIVGVAIIAETASSGVLMTPIAPMLPIVGFTYLTFETDYKPYEALFGKDHVFYEYPKM